MPLEITIFFQKSLTVQEANPPGCLHDFTGKSWEVWVTSVFPPPLQLSSLNPTASPDLGADHWLLLTSRMVRKWHNFTLITRSSYKLQQGSHSPHLQQRNSIEFHSAFSLCTLFFGKQCSFWQSLAVWVHKWIYICFKAKPWLRTIYSVLGM